MAQEITQGEYHNQIFAARQLLAALTVFLETNENIRSAAKEDAAKLADILREQYIPDLQYDLTSAQERDTFKYVKETFFKL